MKAIKRILVKWLLREEAANMERMKSFYEREKDNLSNVPITHLVRKQLTGFDPSMLDGEDDIEESYPEDEGLDAFYNQIAELKKNTALPKIFTFLLRNQIIHAVKRAEDYNQMNFSRASINGIELVREEIDRLEALRLERSSKDEEFDKSEVV